MDYLPIQGSAVPCERVFSSAKETMSNRRNRILYGLMEQLQMLKFSFTAQRGDHLILQPELQRKTFFHTLNNHWVVQSSFQRTYVHLCEISLATSPQKPTLIDRGVIIT